MNTSTHLIPLATAAATAGLRVQLLDVDYGVAFPVLIVEVADGRVLSIDEENDDTGYTANLWPTRAAFDTALETAEWDAEPIYSHPVYSDPTAAVAAYLSALGVTR